jgi:tetratricopeptide (TPR) repeat protein
MIQVNLKMDRFFEAAAEARRLAKQPAWQARTDELLGRIQYARNDPAGAVEFWQRALEHESELTGPTGEGLSPLSPRVIRKDLARALLRARRPAEARGQLQTILAGGPDAEASWLLSRAFLQDGAVAKALGALKEAVSFADENPVLADPAPFVGSASCAGCHSEQFQTQQSSRHARTFHRVSELRDFVPPRPALADPVDARITHTLRKAGDRLEQETQTPERLYQAVVDYAFGSGDRGKTLVGHDPSGRMFELRMSVYPEKTSQPTWDVTSGHAPHPATDQDFLGMPLTDDGVRRCFACHVTNPQAQLETPGPEATDKAIGCEKCHGPGGNHLLAVAAKFPDLAIARPALVSGASVVKICAQCHSPRGKTVVPDDPNSVRFQGTTLTWSRCYTESKDRLDCTTCHNPHRNVSTTASRYEAKCLVCHASGQTEDASNPKERLRRFDLTEAPHATICPVNPATGCISCHMPTVKGVIPHSPLHRPFHSGSSRAFHGGRQVSKAVEVARGSQCHPDHLGKEVWPLIGERETIIWRGQYEERREADHQGRHSVCPAHGSGSRGLVHPHRLESQPSREPAVLRPARQIRRFTGLASRSENRTKTLEYEG